MSINIKYETYGKNYYNIINRFIDAEFNVNMNILLWKKKIYADYNLLFFSIQKHFISLKYTLSKCTYLQSKKDKKKIFKFYISSIMKYMLKNDILKNNITMVKNHIIILCNMIKNIYVLQNYNENEIEYYFKLVFYAIIRARTLKPPKM